MDEKTLTVVAGIVLSLIFSYFPKLSTWYAAKSEGEKKLWMLGLLIVIAGATFGLACANLLENLFGIVVTCDKAGALALLTSVFYAAVGNQVAYLLSPKTKAVKAAKAASKG